MHHT